MNEKYSFKDFTDQQFTRLDSSEFNGKGQIVGSQFHQQVPQTVIFPPGTVVELVKCNVVNCVFSPSIVLTDCVQLFIAPDADGQQWILDPSTLKPTAPLNEDTSVQELDSKIAQLEAELAVRHSRFSTPGLRTVVSQRTQGACRSRRARMRRIGQPHPGARLYLIRSQHSW